MEHRISSETTHEIPRLVSNTKVPHHAHNSPQPLPILTHINRIHTPKPYFPKIRLNIILPSTHMSSQSSLSLRFCNQVARPSHPPLQRSSKYHNIFTRSDFPKIKNLLFRIKTCIENEMGVLLIL